MCTRGKGLPTSIGRSRGLGSFTVALWPTIAAYTARFVLTNNSASLRSRILISCGRWKFSHGHHGPATPKSCGGSKDKTRQEMQSPLTNNDVGVDPDYIPPPKLNGKVLLRCLCNACLLQMRLLRPRRAGSGRVSDTKWWGASDHQTQQVSCVPVNTSNVLRALVGDRGQLRQICE